MSDGPFNDVLADWRRTLGFGAAALMTVSALAACGSGKHMDHTYLLSGVARSVGQAPPDWLTLSVGKYAYANQLWNVVACDSVEHFKQYNESDDESTPGCKLVDKDSWVQVKSLLPQDEKLRYIALVADAKSNKTVGYVGAGDLSPYIPKDTELVVMSLPSSSSDDSDSAIPELVDKNEKKIGNLLDHTRVRVNDIFPDKVTTYVAVTVLTGQFQNREGYIDLDDLNADSGDDDLSGFVGTATDVAAAGPVSTPSPEPLVPTRDEIAQAVSAIFNRQSATPGPDMPPLFTPALLKSEIGARRIMEVVEADDVTSRVDNVHGNAADVTEMYVLTSEKKAKLHFVRHDTWTFAHGSGRWLLDTVSINDKSLQSVDVDGSTQTISDSKYEPSSGRVLFTMYSTRFAWTPNKNLGWSVVALATPVPAAAQLPPIPPADTTSQNPPAGFTPDRTPTDPYSDCDSESIDSVSEDGAVVKLLDGRRFLIQESERYMTSIWLAAEDVTVCDPGPGQSAKLIHDDDVVYGGHLQ